VSQVSLKNPSVGPDAQTFVRIGAKDVQLIQEGQVWRFITPIFLHAGIFHLLFNIYAQLRFGMALERRWTLLKFIFLYFVSGFGATLMSCLLKPKSIGVGSSGAIMGLMGGYLSEIILLWGKTDNTTRKIQLTQVTIVIIFTLVLSTVPFIDFGAHFGGLVVGFLLGNIYFASQSSNYFLNHWLHFISTGCLILYFVGGLALLYTVISV